MKQSVRAKVPPLAPALWLHSNVSCEQPACKQACQISVVIPGMIESVK